MTGPANAWDVDGVEVSPIQQRAVMRDLRRALVDPQLDGVVLARALYTGQWKEGFDSAVECVDARIEHLTAHIEGLADPVPPAPPSRRGLDALDVRDGSVAPGGWVCDVCRCPVESEPCREHQPKAYAEMRAEARATRTPGDDRGRELADDEDTIPVGEFRRLLRERAASPPAPAGSQAEGAAETVRVGDLEADHATVNGVVLRDRTPRELGLCGRGTTTVHVTTTADVVLQHAWELTKPKRGEGRFETWARGLDELGYTIVPKPESGERS